MIERIEVPKPVCASLGDIGRHLAAPGFTWPLERVVHIGARDIRRYDAVGEFCLQLADLLSAHGVPVQLYAENWNDEHTPQICAVSDLLQIAEPSDLVFYHFSTEDPALPEIAALPCRKLVYFHGITPPSFFDAYDPIAAMRVRAGEAQIGLTRQFDLVLSNSEATAATLRSVVGSSAIGKVIICPPVLGIQRWKALPSEFSTEPPAARFILFVGRLAPNKSLLRLLAAFQMLAVEDSRTHLVIVGDAAISAYSQDVHALAQSITEGIGERILFRKNLDMASLRHLYETATLFITLSEHEGFCVPILEAMQFGLPVLAATEPAIDELLSKVGRIEESSPAGIAQALARGLDDNVWREEIRRLQQERFLALSVRTDGRLIWQALERVLRLDARSL